MPVHESDRESFQGLSNWATWFARTMKFIFKDAAWIFVYILWLSACNLQSPSAPISQPEAAKSVPVEQKPDIGEWDIEPPEVNAIDGTKTQVLSTGPLGSVLALCFKDGRLCSGEGLGVYVTSPCIVEGNDKDEATSYERWIRLKFDAEQPRSEKWGIADGRKGIFPHSQKGFVAELYKHKQVMVEFGCDIGDNDVVTYDIHNLRAAIATAGLKP